jgi:hypothetical protein
MTESRSNEERYVEAVIGGTDVVLIEGWRDLHGWPDQEYDYDVRTRVRVGDRRVGIEVAEVRVTARPDGPAVTMDGLRRDHLGEVLGWATRLQVMDDDADRAGSGRQRRDLAPVGPISPRRVLKRDLERAASAYRRAQAEGRPTGKEVADELGVSLSTARKRVFDARNAGLLPPTGGTTRPRL